MLTHVEHLDYGPYLRVRMVADADGFLDLFDEDAGPAMQADPFHPFTKLVHEQMMLHNGDADLVMMDFDLGDDMVDYAVIVADNAVTRSLIAGIRDPESLETGNTPADWYRAELVRALANMWD